MRAFKAAYINELYKISKKKKVVVAAILTLAAVVIGGLIAAGINNFLGIKVTGSSEFSILALSVLNYTLIPLFTAFVCIDMFTGEFSDHTIKQTLTRPVSRFKIYSAKTLAAATFLMAHLMFTMVLSLLISFVIGATSLSVFQVFGSYLAAFLPLFVFALMVVFISNLARGTTSAFMFSVLIYLVMAVLQLRLSNYQSFFFTSMMDWYNLFLNSYINVQKILRIFLILAGSGLMFFAGGYYLFDRKEI